MSFQAVTWAIGQKAGSPSAKAALWSIANYANEHWCAWPSQATIAEESEQSPDTVQKRLVELAEAHVIRRIPLRFAGRRTVDFIILAPSPYFLSKLAEIEPFLPRGCVVDKRFCDAAADCGSDENVTPTLPQTLPQVEAHAAALVRQQEPVMEPRNQDERDARASEGRKHAERLIAFEARWPTAAIDDRVRTALAWNELTDEEQDAAVAGIAPFLENLKRARRTTVPAAWKYLGQKSWTLIEDRTPQGGIEVVDLSSPQGRAMVVLCLIAGAQLFSENGKIVLRQKLISQTLALADAPPRPDWVFICRSAVNQCGAWNEFLSRELAAQGKRRPPLIGDAGGFFAPWPFPPRKDGTVSTTGPPVSDPDDDAEFHGYGQAG